MSDPATPPGCPGAAAPDPADDSTAESGGTRSLDADLGDLIAAGVPDLAAFEAEFVAAVESGGGWDRFYDGTLERVVAGWTDPPAGDGTVATFTRIWARAARLTRGDSVLDVGTCFGFLPLAWAARSEPPTLTAVDLDPGTAALAARQGRRLGRDVRFGCADATRLPFADRSAGTVLLLHVLEHLRPPAASAALAEALRVADRRVIVAVPVEDRPDPVFGHVQTYTLAKLAAIGAATGWHTALIDADGAWLALDRPG